MRNVRLATVRVLGALATILWAYGLSAPAKATTVQILGPTQPGIQPVNGTFAATGQSASWTPLAGQGFNIHLTGTFVGTVQLERQLNGVWAPVTVSAGGSIIQMELWSAPASDVWGEPQYGVSYRLNCTAYTSGTITYQVSQ